MKFALGLLTAGALALAAVSPASAQSTFRLRSVKVPAENVQEVEKLGKFYQTVTGFKSVRRVERPDFLEIILGPGATVEAAMASPMNTRIVLISRNDVPRETDPLSRVVLEVSDMNAAIKAWTDHGGKVTRAAQKSSASTATVAFVRDPQGNLVELIQP
jgi:predicted enzyme related to lactoylglutathione lyase